MNNRNDGFSEVLEVWLQEGSSDEDPYRIMDRALARIEATSQSRFGWLSRVVAVTDGSLRFAIAAMAVAAVAVAGLVLASSGSRLGGPGGQASAAPSVPAAANVLGLPPVGAAASDTTPGELVLRFDSSSLSRADTIWLYADGRIISAPFLSTPAGVGDAYTGLVEQRLTSDGVAHLVSQVEATGLFAGGDLELAMGTATGYFQVALRTGDAFSRVTWGHWVTGATEPTTEQMAGIQSINELFRTPSSWPATVWADDTLRAYVPSTYAVCIGVKPDGAAPGEWTGPVDPAAVQALLPQAAQELLAAGQPTDNHDAMHADAGCTAVTTEAARELARSFAGSAIHRSQASRYFVAYEYLNPTPSWDSLWIQFGPFMPHGSAIWLGPG